MSTAEVEVTDFTPVVRYSVSDAAIAEMQAAYMPLVIAGVEDAEGYRRVHEARMTVKGTRVEIEKKRKELKSEALEYGRRVDGEAKRLTGLLEPIESHLSQVEDAYAAEKERIRNEAKLKAEAEQRAKIEAELAEQRAKQEAEAAMLKAEQEAAAAKLKVEQDAEAARLRAEREKLEAERRAIEAERARQKAEQDRIDAQRRAEQEKLDAARREVEAEKKRLADIEAARLQKIEEERLAAERAAELERAKVEAAERARREAEEKAAREAAAAKAKAEAEAAARAKAEALRPDREKLLAVAKAVSAIEVPAVSPDAVETAKQVQQVLVNASIKIQSIVTAMSQI